MNVWIGKCGRDPTDHEKQINCLVASIRSPLNYEEDDSELDDLAGSNPNDARLSVKIDRKF